MFQGVAGGGQGVFALDLAGGFCRSRAEVFVLNELGQGLGGGFLAVFVPFQAEACAEALDANAVVGLVPAVWDDELRPAGAEGLAGGS